MNCPNCGKEIQQGQKFCTHCGTKISSDKSNERTFYIKKTVILAAISIIAFVIIISFTILLFGDNNIAKDISTPQEIEKSAQTPAEVLSEIDEYQNQYWEIIKRNDVLLEEFEDLDQDHKDLNELFKTVERKIDKNNVYLKRYHSIEKEFAENPGETTVEMDEFASKEYNAVDKLLNDTYQAVKAKIPQEDFKNLITDELKWLKDLEAYRKVFDAQGYGTIRDLKYCGYQVNMRKFRTLLLMLYL